MEAKTENVDNDDIVIIVENEAESLPAEEERLKQQGAFGLMDTCPICKLSFHNREPKLLPCLHSFCKRCLPAPYRSAEPRRDLQTHPDNAKPLGAILCPVCKQECWELDVLDNFFVKDSAEAPSSTMEKNSQVCMSCEDNTEATGYCIECVEFLCVTCIEAHQRVKFTRDHTIRQKQDMSPESLDISTQRPVFCDIHKQEPLKLFCETCDRLTCRDCQLLRHKDHNYQFLEDAYRNHKQYLEHMTQQLQEKRKTIEEVSNYITNGLQQVEENRKGVTNEIKKSICNLIMEINRKGKILINQLEALTKDHELGLKKQQDDVSSLSKHLDHVIRFTKWATASHSGTALLYCKRLILYQIHYLMRSNCSPSLIPQSSVRFQCRSGFWATNVDLGTLVVERGTARPPLTNPTVGPRIEAPPSGLTMSAQQRQTTLAQLQMQPPRQPAPNQWPWYQNMRLPGPLGSPNTRPVHGGSSPSQSGAAPTLVQMGRRYGSAQTATRSPTSTMFNSNSFPPPQSVPRYTQPLQPGTVTQASLQQRGQPDFLRRSEPGASLPSVTISVPKPSVLTAQALNTTTLNTVQAMQSSSLIKPSTTDRQTGTVSWKPPSETSPAAKRRRRLSPGPIIVIKDEPEDEDEVSFVQSSVGSSLPDSSTPAKSKPRPPQKTCPSVKVTIPVSSKPSEKATPQTEKGAEPEDDPNEDWCAVCQNGGELLCCDKCPKVFHLNCHIPTLNESPSGEWYCSLCRNLEAPEMEYVSDRKDDPGTEKFPIVDRRKCERLLLRMFCNDISTDFQQPASPAESKKYKELITTPMDLSIVKKRLEAKSSDSECYTCPEGFVSDVRLIFINCAKYYKATSEVGSAGLYLEEYFEEQLKLVYPDKVFPGGREEGMIPPLEDEIEEEETEIPQKEETDADITDKSPPSVSDEKLDNPTENEVPEEAVATEKEEQAAVDDKTEEKSSSPIENVLEKDIALSNEESTTKEAEPETEMKDAECSPEVKNEEIDKSLEIAQPEEKATPPPLENTVKSETIESSDMDAPKEEQEEEKEEEEEKKS
ncbi:transcription intermediary factor 1-alpha isoform X2 [Boleophthalmus pectinirostris]|uniref:transcription intermediary factor 1-alpha isoform X2 n=1 Tax=Boleophthalmus pectinirostris TaxID=150288 RepID=UPI00242F04CB|nr:transcription intermediary factor 1-alpha isoform X2 [Boleophthalmus pectinirostris]